MTIPQPARDRARQAALRGHENKVKNIEYFHDEDVPSAGIIFDVSGSMGQDRPPRSAQGFIQTSHDNDDFFLIGFNQRANLLAEFTDGGTMQGKLTLVEPKADCFYDAAYLGIEKVKQGHHTKRALLLIWTGRTTLRGIPMVS